MILRFDEFTILGVSPKTYLISMIAGFKGFEISHVLSLDMKLVKKVWVRHYGGERANTP